MREILTRLPQSAFILDVGSSRGSFDTRDFCGTAIRLDLESQPGMPDAPFVQADAAMMPFAAGTFDAVVCCHSLEHLKDLNHGLSEIGRVLKQGGSLFVSVPDASTLTDRIFRWLAGPAGGHVNLFRVSEQVISLVEKHARISHVATRILCSSLSFLHRKNRRRPAGLKCLLFLGGSERLLVLISILSCLCDRYLHTRTSVYGWALYFGGVGETVDLQAWINVCVRCGQGHPSAWLEQTGAVRRRWGFLPMYDCPGCGTHNYFARDEHYAFLSSS